MRLLRMTYIAAAIACAASLVRADCDSDFACHGRSVTLTNGSCAKAPSPCDDGNSCTTDSCSLLGYCTIKASSSSVTGCTCLSNCTRQCDGKQCGNDGCGGFCGVCAQGQGCNAQFQCTNDRVQGSCTLPIAVGTIDRTQTISIEGDTSSTLATHVLTPLCNFQSASPELIYSFTVAVGKTIGFEIRVSGYDSVVSLMKNECYTNATVACNDDATPPGNYGSSISGTITEGTYFIQVDGYDSEAKGPFVMTMRFYENCQPKCDGAFCGSDGCGGTCGACDTGLTCNFANARCYPINCQPRCAEYNRTCGEDGCGGTCGNCTTNYGCIHASITPDDEEAEAGIETPASYCEFIPTCNYTNPVCFETCGATQYCGSDCACYDVDTKLPDLVVAEADARDDMWTHQIDVTNTSCQLVEKCVGGTGKRNLLRFTASSTNQGQADFTPPSPKDNPQMFEWGTCHQHYHFKSFMLYQLLNDQKVQVHQVGYKAAFCMEDSRRVLDGPDVPCEKQYDCGSQGISRGWADSYGWSLDCSWIDVTGIPAGVYYLRIAVNPERRIAEASYTNNQVCIKVNLPDASKFSGVPQQVLGNEVVDCNGILPSTSSATRHSAGAVLLALFAIAMALAM